MAPQTLEALHAGALVGSRHLRLACGLQHFPPEILTLADTLEVLDLSGNALDTLPEELTQLRRLRILFCSNNRFSRLPEVLGRCPALSMVGFKANRIVEVPAAALPKALRWLILTDNAIELLPENLGHCALLQKLMLSGNRLSALPETLRHCHRLELLRIAANRLETLPAWLFELPRLAWLACAGNPFCTQQEAAALDGHAIPDIPWSTIEIESLLGEGASGDVYRAHQGDGSEPVAVKVFKGAMTSDGLPQSEMAAALHAERHEGLIPLRGWVSGHPEGKTGLVLSLVEPTFRNLAGPPSMDSCTRDVYADDFRLSGDALQKLALGVASATAQLHRRGILHGDLYAHNILFNGAGQGLIGDFGAASLYAPDGGSFALGMQRIEVRAFGILLGELLDRCSRDWPGYSVALSLQAACCQSPPAVRPTFDEILAVLESLG